MQLQLQKDTIKNQYTGSTDSQYQSLPSMHNIKAIYYQASARYWVCLSLPCTDLVNISRWDTVNQGSTGLMKISEAEKQWRTYQMQPEPQPAECIRNRLQNVMGYNLPDHENYHCLSPRDPQQGVPRMAQIRFSGVLKNIIGPLCDACIQEQPTFCPCCFRTTSSQFSVHVCRYTHTED